LSEFDFLHQEDEYRGEYEPPTADTVELNATNNKDSAKQMQIIIPQVSLPIDLLHPVLSMPPVILMGGTVNRDSYFNYNSFTASPIIEMPPSPAPNQMPMIEFPDDDDDDDDILNVEEECYDEINIVEVRFMIFFFFPTFDHCCLLLFSF
jgi:hypothetical protein